MARCPFAEWKPVPNFSKGGITVLGLVPHVIVGSLAGAEATFMNNNKKQPGGRRSAHFGVGKNGYLKQWVDTKDTAWAQAAGNSSYVSVECEGQATEAHTPAQIATLAKLLVWANEVHKVPFEVVNTPGQHGVISHRNGGSAWGGHSCPGDQRHAQRGEIVALARALTNSFPLPLPFEFPEEIVRRVSVQVPVLKDGTGYWDLDGAPGRPLVPFDKWTGAQPTVNGGPMYPTSDFPMVVQVKDFGGNVRLWLGGFSPGSAPLIFITVI